MIRIRSHYDTTIEGKAVSAGAVVEVQDDDVAYALISTGRARGEPGSPASAPPAESAPVTSPPGSPLRPVGENHED